MLAHIAKTKFFKFKIQCKVGLGYIIIIYMQVFNFP